MCDFMLMFGGSVMVIVSGAILLALVNDYRKRKQNDDKLQSGRKRT